MNRAERRAIARTERRQPQAHPEKHSYKLPRQLCALWCPDAGGYIAEFSPSGFRVAPYAGLAHVYEDEDEAASAAITFREVTGFRVAVRPVYACS